MISKELTKAIDLVNAMSGRTTRNETVIIEDGNDDRGGGGIEANAYVKLIKEAKTNNNIISSIQGHK